MRAGQGGFKKPPCHCISSSFASAAIPFAYQVFSVVNLAVFNLTLLAWRLAFGDTTTTAEYLGMKGGIPREAVEANCDYVGAGYGIPTDGSFLDLPPDWERMAPYLEAAMSRVPRSTPSTRMTKATFWKTVKRGMRRKSWKMKPTVRR